MAIRSRIWLALWLVFACFALVSCGGGDVAESNSPNATSNQSGETPVFSADLEVVGNLDDLSGELIFIEQRAQPNFRVAQLDLTTGEVDTLFQVPENAWIYEVAVPSDEQLVFSYSPPSAADGSAQLDRSGIYTLDLSSESSTPEAWIEPEGAKIFIAYPTFSRDHSLLYYSRIDQSGEESERQVITLMAYDVASATSERVMPYALMPSFGGEENIMAYVRVNRITQVRSLQIASLAQNIQMDLVPELEFYDIGRPLFSPDGSWIYFVALEDPLNSEDVLGNLLLGQPAYAHGNHNLPGDWWRRSRNGQLTQVFTDLSVLIYDGVFSPDGQHFAFSTAEGIYVIGVDDASKPQLIVESRAIRDIDWIR